MKKQKLVRTTVDLPRESYKKLKKSALDWNTTLRRVLIHLIDNKLDINACPFPDCKEDELDE